jgi:hypothetical protein
MTSENVVKLHSDLHHQALNYVSLGVRIFPCLPGTKTPAIGAWQHNASNDPEQIGRWWSAHPDYNIAFRPAEAGWFVVDVDRAYENDLHLPPTFTVETPSGGRHLYYESDEDYPNKKITKGVDARSAHGYVLMHPSVVDDRDPQAHGIPEKQGTYTVIDRREPAPLPDDVRSRMGRKQEKALAQIDGLDTPRALERAEILVRHAPLAVEGDGSDEATLRLAQRVIDEGVSEEAALEIMAPWADRCGFDHDWLETKIANAAKYRQNEPGCRAIPAAADVPAFADYLASSRKRLTWINGARIEERAVAPVREIIPGYIERGLTTFLVGVGGLHKSRLALQWGLSIAAGAPVFGKLVERCPFKYVSYEDDLDEVTRRWHAIRDGLGLPGTAGADLLDMSAECAPMAVISEAGGIVLSELWHELAADLDDTPEHKFVVIDSCYNAFLFEGQAKVNETLVAQLCTQLDRFCREHNCTILMLWHPSAAGEDNGGGWSQAWHNKPRARFRISAENGEGFKLECLKKSHGAKPAPTTLHFEDGVLVPADQSKAVQSLRDAAVYVAIRFDEQGDRIKRDGKIGKDKITRDHGAMRLLAQRTGVEYSVAQFLNALEAALDLRLLQYVENPGGRKGQADPAGYAAP